MAEVVPNITDWLGVSLTFAGVLFAAIGGWIALQTFRHQRDAHDIGVSLTIFSEINRYWDCIVRDGENYDYYIGQILAQFETAAGLIKTGILTKKASLVLEDHILEVFAKLKSSPRSNEAIERSRSSSNTFENLEWLTTRQIGKALNAVKFQERRLAAM